MTASLDFNDGITILSSFFRRAWNRGSFTPADFLPPSGYELFLILLSHLYELDELAVRKPPPCQTVPSR